MATWGPHLSPQSPGNALLLHLGVTNSDLWAPLGSGSFPPHDLYQRGAGWSTAFLGSEVRKGKR